MSRTLLLAFVHGFKGNDGSFQDFPEDLRRQVAKQLPDHKVKSIVYPQYETKGELAQASEAFLEWLKQKVLNERREVCETPWPPSDDRVGVILVAHSMGGFVAADTLFLALNERAANPEANQVLFPLIRGLLTFDTPYNGLARSMFVYGAFSNYSKVQGVFNAMTALSAAAPSTLRRLGSSTAMSSTVPSAPRGSGPQWTAWQLIAVRTGTVGAIAAGGVLAYQHRASIKKGVQSVRNMNKESLAKGYRSSIDALGQGLAYINRGNVGKSFAWLSDHLTFVGALLKQEEMKRRLERLGALKGVGVHDTYCSLGENGYWSGGYFVPERTFCAVPEPDHPTHAFFARNVMPDVDDEVQAHMNMFRPSKNAGYGDMVESSANLVEKWFVDDDPIDDDPRFRETNPEELNQDQEVEKILSQSLEKTSSAEQPAQEAAKPDSLEDVAGEDETVDLPDESPIDIAAAATLVPLPGSDGDLLADASTDDVGDVGEGAERGQNAKRTYVQHLFGIAHAAGAEAKGWWPNKVPNMPQVQLPAMPKMPDAVSSLSMNPFSANKRQKTDEGVPSSGAQGDKENPITIEPGQEDGPDKSGT